MTIRFGEVRTASLAASVAALAILDRLLKTLVEQPVFSFSRVGWRYFGFEQFHNPGVAFGIPIPLWFVLPVTVFFLIALALWARQEGRAKGSIWIAYAAILAGALSNAYDRLTFGYTIDYIRIINSIINIADLLVLVGIAALLFLKKD